ncbi:MAG: hypothetical protein WBG92_15155 [Thiohalocapsa sp.]
MPLVSPAAPGTWIPASALGDSTLEPEAPAITGRNGERVNTIEACLRADALPIDVANRLRATINGDGLSLPMSYRLEFACDSAEQGKAIALRLAYAPLLGALMLTAMVPTFRSFTLAGIVLPVGLSSVSLGILSLWFSGYPLGFNPILGSAGLIGA